MSDVSFSIADGYYWAQRKKDNERFVVKYFDDRFFEPGFEQPQTQEEFFYENFFDPKKLQEPDDNKQFREFWRPKA
jgi:hypothetical protein